MSKDMVRLSGSQIAAYFKEQETRRIRYCQPHKWEKLSKNIPWPWVCDECGLCWLNNKATQREIDRGCVFFRLEPVQVLSSRK